MAKVRRISKESKSSLNHYKNERERALAHNANERVRYHNTKEQLMMLSMYVPGQDKESVHDTLSRIRLFNLGLEHFKSNLDGSVFNEFTVDEKLSFSSFVSKHKRSGKESNNTPKKVKKKRPHVVHISSHSKDSNENNLIQTLQRLFNPCHRSEEETMQSEPFFLSQHKVSQNMENFEFSEKLKNSYSKSVFMEEEHNVYSEKDSFCKYQEEKHFKDSKVDAKKSELPVNNFTILKYKQCELFLEDYENEVSCDKNSATLTVNEGNKITNMEMEPAFLKHYFDSESEIQDLYTTSSSTHKHSLVSDSFAKTKFLSYQPATENFEQCVASDLDIDKIIHSSCKNKLWNCPNENPVEIEGSYTTQESKIYDHEFETHDAEFKKNGKLSDEMCNSIENPLQPYISESGVIGTTVPFLGFKEQKINDGMHEQFTFCYPANPEAIGEASEEQFYLSGSVDLSSAEILRNVRAENITEDEEPQEIALEIDMPLYGDVRDDGSIKKDANDFEGIHHHKKNQEIGCLGNENWLISENTVFKSTRGDGKAVNSLNVIYSHGRQVFADVTNQYIK